MIDFRVCLPETKQDLLFSKNIFYYTGQNYILLTKYLLQNYWKKLYHSHFFIV